MRAFFTLITLLFAFSPASRAQTEINLLSKWDYKRKATLHDQVNKVITSLNGYIIAVGETISPDLQHTEALFLVIDPEEGKEILRKTYGGAGNDSFNSVAQNHDGTFTIVGSTSAGKKADLDGWILQVDLEGDQLHEEKVAGSDKEDEIIKDIAINNQGQLLAIGSQKKKKESTVFTLSIEPEKMTRRDLVNLGLGSVEGIVAAQDDAFALVGSTDLSNDVHTEDAWVMKVDYNGQDLWGGPKFFGDRNLQEGLGITATIDGGFAMVGVTNSKGAGLSDKWLIKLDREGLVEWEKTYGKTAEDIATCVIELAEGGYAIFGQTKSYMLRASTTMLELLITDARGNELESNTYPIYQATGNETAHSLVESYNNDLILAGNSIATKNEASTLYIGAFSYKPFEREPNKVDLATDQYGNTSQLRGLIALSEPSFSDNNSNQRLESGERGYFGLQIRNQSSRTINRVSSRISGEGENRGLDYWQNIQIGTLRAGQSKYIYVPVKAMEKSGKGEFQLTMDILVNDAHATSTSMTLKTDDQPAPAQLVINRSNFVPGANPSPGMPIRLDVELINTGEMAAQAFTADFQIPPGVKSTGSELQRIPGIRPREAYNISFPFTFDDSFRGASIPITFTAQGPGMAPVKKTFHLSLGNAAPVDPQVTQPQVARNGQIPDEMVWASPDPSDFQARRVSVNQRDVDLKVIALSEKPLAKTKFNVLINGKKHQGQKMDEAKLGPPAKDAGRNRQSYSNKIRLSPGMNQVQIVYLYEDGSEFKSPPMEIEYQPKGNPNLYVYSIGIAHEDLKFTVKDARDIATEFSKLHDERGIGFRKVDVKVMTGKEETTVLNIRNSFIDLTRQNIKENDLVVVFISSHGKVDYKQNFILMPSDFDSRYEETTSINFQADILDKLKMLNANILVMIDACHSGGALTGARDYDEGASKVMSSLIEASSGVEVIASCSADEFSFEDASWGNGAFTKAILEAFRNEKVDIDGRMVKADIYGDNPETYQKEFRSDGAITIEELIEFVQQRVPYLVEKVKKKKQNPTHKSLDRLPRDTGIFYLRDNN